MRVCMRTLHGKQCMIQETDRYRENGNQSIDASIQIDDDVDGSNKNLGSDEDDDYIYHRIIDSQSANGDSTAE